jgi:hypothetical protein
MIHNKFVIHCRELVVPREKNENQRFCKKNQRFFKEVVGLIAVFKDNPLASPLFTPLQTTNLR